MKLHTSIGIETHIQLTTKSKIFSSESTSFKSKYANYQANIFDLGFPGTLPVLNIKTIYMAIKFGLCINAKINKYSVFERKNYFYPDLPKGYQISQNRFPIIEDGYINIENNNKKKKIKIIQAHLEEDSGKSVHNKKDNLSYLDFNRSGIPLLEVVSEPSLNSSNEAIDYIKKLYSIVCYLNICDGNLENGSFRCDINISISHSKKYLGNRVEIKNLNSFKFIKKAIEYEIKRQSSLIDRKMKVIKETRLLDTKKFKTFTMRKKEERNDYRYFPDPDLFPVKIEKSLIENIKNKLPELPEKKFKRFIKKYNINKRYIKILISNKELSNFFEKFVSSNNIDYEYCARWIVTDIFRFLKLKKIKIETLNNKIDILSVLLNKIKKKDIFKKDSNYILNKILDKKKINLKYFNKLLNVEKISDKKIIKKYIKKVIKENYLKYQEYKNGNTKIFKYFIGLTIKEMKGRVDPLKIKEILNNELNY